MSSLIIQPPSIDSFLNQVTATTNYGSDNYLSVRSLTGPSNRRIVLNFDFSTLPVGATITAATLELYMSAQDGFSTGRTYYARRVTSTDWVELQVTWNQRAESNNWTSAGGDYTTTDQASTTVPASASWMSWNVTALAQYAQANTSEILYLLIMDGTENNATERYANFHSREYVTDTSLRPKLTITYTGGTEVTTKYGGFML